MSRCGTLISESLESRALSPRVRIDPLDLGLPNHTPGTHAEARSGVGLSVILQL